MKKTTISLKISLLLFLFSCSTNQERAIISFENLNEPVAITGKQVFDNHINVIQATGIDSLLIIVVAGQEPLFHVYNTEHKPLGSFGRNGRGPGEFQTFALLQHIIKDEYGVTGIVYNNPSHHLYRIDMLNSVKENKTKLSGDVIEVPVALADAIGGMFLYNDFTLAGMNDFRRLELFQEQRDWFIYDFEMDDINIISAHNVNVEPYNQMAELNINNRVNAIKPDRSKIASVMIFNPRLEILDIATGDISTFLLEDYIYPESYDLQDFMEEKLITHYHYLTATDQHIYLLHSGKKMEEEEDGQIKTVQVLDWKGNPQCHFTIGEEYDISQFYVLEQEQRLYGVSYNTDKLYTFDYSPAQCLN